MSTLCGVVPGLRRLLRHLLPWSPCLCVAACGCSRSPSPFASQSRPCPCCLSAVAALFSGWGDVPAAAALSGWLAGLWRRARAGAAAGSSGGERLPAAAPAGRPLLPPATRKAEACQIGCSQRHPAVASAIPQCSALPPAGQASLPSALSSLVQLLPSLAITALCSSKQQEEARAAAPAACPGWPHCAAGGAAGQPGHAIC